MIIGYARLWLLRPGSCVGKLKASIIKLMATHVLLSGETQGHADLSLPARLGDHLHKWPVPHWGEKISTETASRHSCWRKINDKLWVTGVVGGEGYKLIWGRICTRPDSTGERWATQSLKERLRSNVKFCLGNLYLLSHFQARVALSMPGHIKKTDGPDPGLFLTYLNVVHFP